MSDHKVCADPKQCCRELSRIWDALGITTPQNQPASEMVAALKAELADLAGRHELLTLEGAALTRDRDALKAGLAKMIAELEAALPAMNTATLIAHVHGQPYSGPTIDLEGAKKTLASTGGA